MELAYGPTHLDEISQPAHMIPAFTYNEKSRSTQHKIPCRDPWPYANRSIYLRLVGYNTVITGVTLDGSVADAVTEFGESVN